MASEVKNLIKTGMRNPFVVEVKTEENGIFSQKLDSQMSVKVTQFDQLSK
tara:strand:+ start:566 stop:715 length:150 start_codon:yes stop_codon:yes gene_type:complete